MRNIHCFLQEDELKALKEKLEKEMDMLKDFQNRQKNCLEENCKREEQKLAERTSIRKAVIEKKVCYMLLQQVFYKGYYF